MLVEIVITLILVTSVETGENCRRSDSFEQEWCYFNTKLDDLETRLGDQEADMVAIKQLINDTLYKRPCDEGWVYHSGSCYLFSKEMLNFTDAQSYCKQHNASLVHVDDESENTFCKLYVWARDDGSYWVGLTDVETEGEWRWEDNNELHEDSDFSDWSSGEPNNSGAGEDCVCLYIGKGLTWNDIPCSKTFAPICEVKL